MQVAFKNIGIKIPLTVEIAECEPIGVKELFGIAETESAEKQLFKLHIGDSVFFT